MTRILAREPVSDDLLATAPAKAVAATIHVTTTASLCLEDEASAALKRIRQQMETVLRYPPVCRSSGGAAGRVGLTPFESCPVDAVLTAGFR